MQVELSLASWRFLTPREVCTHRFPKSSLRETQDPRGWRTRAQQTRRHHQPRGRQHPGARHRVDQAGALKQAVRPAIDRSPKGSYAWVPGAPLLASVRALHLHLEATPSSNFESTSAHLAAHLRHQRWLDHIARSCPSLVEFRSNAGPFMYTSWWDPDRGQFDAFLSTFKDQLEHLAFPCSDEDEVMKVRHFTRLRYLDVGLCDETKFRLLLDPASMDCVDSLLAKTFSPSINLELRNSEITRPMLNLLVKHTPQMTVFQPRLLLGVDESLGCLTRLTHVRLDCSSKPRVIDCVTLVTGVSKCTQLVDLFVSHPFLTVAHLVTALTPLRSLTHFGLGKSAVPNLAFLARMPHLIRGLISLELVSMKQLMRVEATHHLLAFESLQSFRLRFRLFSGALEDARRPIEEWRTRWREAKCKIDQHAQAKRERLAAQMQAHAARVRANNEKVATTAASSRVH